MRTVAITIGVGALGLLAMFNWATMVVSSTSMAPTLCPGDRVVVIGFSTIRRITSFAGLAWGVNHGDLVIVRQANAKVSDGSPLYLIKRVVATGMDRIHITHSTIILNGRPLAETYRQRSDGDDDDAWPIEPEGDGVRDVSVPAHQYFVMGDNRATSIDSRDFGSVSAQDVVARVIAVLHLASRRECIPSRTEDGHGRGRAEQGW